MVSRFRNRCPSATPCTVDRITEYVLWRAEPLIKTSMFNEPYFRGIFLAVDHAWVLIVEAMAMSAVLTQDVPEAEGAICFLFSY